MLTEQDFEDILNETIRLEHEGDEPGNVECWIGGRNEAAQKFHSQHIAECERLMELAFNAAKEQIKVVSGFKTTEYGENGFVEVEKDIMMPKEKYPTFQKFKDSLNGS